MDSLPDELLLSVFSRLDDGLTLLDSVPLVCRRWHRVAVGDPRAWSGVVLRIGQPDLAGRSEPRWDAAAALDAARVLLRAPAIRTVHLDLTYVTSDRALDMVFAGLRRSRAAVRELHLQDPLQSVMSPGGRADLLGMLWRNRDHLRAVSLGHLLHSEYAFGTAQSPGGGRLTVLGVLAGLRGLEELQLAFHFDEFDKGPSHAREALQAAGLAAGLPRLRRLALHIVDLDDGHDYGETLAVRMLHCFAATLREVDLHVSLDLGFAGFDPFGLCKPSFAELRALLGAVRRALAACVALRVVGAHVRDAVVAQGLPRLRALRLRLDGLHDMLEADEDGFRESIAHLQDFEGSLPALRSLVLADDSAPGHLYCRGCQWVHPSDEARRRRLLGTLLVAVARLGPGVAELRVDAACCALLQEALPAVLDATPGLRALALRVCPVELVPRLLDRRDLRRLSGRVLARNTRDYAFCQDVTESFRRLRPDMRSDALLCELLH